MGTQTVLRSRFPRLARGSVADRPVGPPRRSCCSTLRALGGVPHATVHFRREIIRLIAEISMGQGPWR